MRIHKDIDCILADKNEIDMIVTELADEFNRVYKYIDGIKTKLLVIGILKGATVFMADLIRKLEIPIQIDFMQAASYGTSTESSGEINIKLDLSTKYAYNLSEFDILIVEDIIDTGYTLKKLSEELEKRGAKSVATCVFLNKPSRRKAEYIPNYTGKDIPDVFVVGYGLDYSEKYRELPYIGVLKSSVYN